MHKILILAIFISTALYFARIYPPIASTDTYFHLSTGREVARTHQIPDIDTTTYVAQDRPWIANEWLSGLIFYLTYVKFSGEGLIVLRVITGLATIFFLYKTLTILKINDYLKILAILTTAVVVSIRLLDRPEMFSFLLLSIVIYIMTLCSRVDPCPKLPAGINPVFFLIPIFLAWPNIQGYAPIGLAVFGYYLTRQFILWYLRGEDVFERVSPRRGPELDEGSSVSEVLSLTKDRRTLAFDERARKASEQKRKKATFYLLTAFVLCVLATSFTPDQFKRFLYVLFLNRDLFAYVVEVQSIAQKLASIKYNFWANVPLEIYIYTVFSLVGLISFFPRLKTKNLAILTLDLVYFLTLLIVAFLFVRTIPVYILLTMPLVAANISRTHPDVRQGTSTRLLLLIPSGTLIVLIATSILAGKITGERTNSLYVTNRQGQILVATTATWMARQPTSALDFVKTNLDAQKVLTSFNWSNQVIWQLQGSPRVEAGQAKVVGDIIYEKQTTQSLDDYRKLQRGHVGWQEVLESQNPDIVINTQPFNLVEFFQVPVWELPDWYLVYVDDVATVYVKNLPSFARTPLVDLTALHPEFTSDFKFNLEEKEQAQKDLERLLTIDSHNSFARQQLILLLISEQKFQEAQTLAGESIRLIPKDPNFYLLLATVKAASDNCQGVASLLSQAKNKATGYYFLQRKIELLAAQCQVKI